MLDVRHAVTFNHDACLDLLVTHLMGHACADRQPALHGHKPIHMRS